MGYAPPGTNPTELVALAQEAERLGYDSAWAAEAWGTDVVTVLSWLGGDDDDDQARRRDHADSRPHARDDGDDRGDARPDVGRPLPARARHVGAAGRRGLARPAVGQAACETREYVEIVRPRSCAARRSSTTASTTRFRTAGEDATGLGKPLKLMLQPAPRRDPDLPRRDRPEERRARRRDRRRLAAGLGLAGAASPRSSARAATAPRGLRRRRRRRPGRRSTDDLQAARDVVKPHLALYVGGMGAQGQNFYNALVAPLRLRGGGRARSRSSTSAARSCEAMRRGARTRSSTRSRSSARASGSPTGSTRGRESRRDDTPRPGARR